IRVTWKIPEEMAAGFENQEYIDTMQRNAFISGSYLDENGDTVPSSEVHDIKYVSIDTSNHTIEYNLSQLLDEHNLTLNDLDGLSVPSSLLSIYVLADLEGIPEGTYPVQVAVTDGPANPEEVTGAHTIDFVVE